MVPYKSNGFVEGNAIEGVSGFDPDVSEADVYELVEDDPAGVPVGRPFMFDRELGFIDLFDIALLPRRVQTLRCESLAGMSRLETLLVLLGFILLAQVTTGTAPLGRRPREAGLLVDLLRVELLITFREEELAPAVGTLDALIGHGAI